MKLSLPLFISFRFEKHYENGNGDYFLPSNLIDRFRISQSPIAAFQPLPSIPHPLPPILQLKHHGKALYKNVPHKMVILERKTSGEIFQNFIKK